MNANRPEITKPEGNGALEFYINVATKETEMILNSLPKMVEKTGVEAVEALISDPVQFFVELGPMRLGIPYIDVATAVYFDYFGHTPFCVYEPAKYFVRVTKREKRAFPHCPEQGVACAPLTGSDHREKFSQRSTHHRDDRQQIC